MFKKTLIFVLACILAFSFVACKSDDATDGSTEQQTITVSPTAPDTVTNALTKKETITVNTTGGAEMGNEAVTLDEAQQEEFNEIFNALTLKRREIPKKDEVPTGGGYYITITEGKKTTGYSFISKEIILIDGAYYKISEGDFDAIVSFASNLLKSVETTSATSAETSTD